MMNHPTQTHRLLVHAIICPDREFPKLWKAWKQVVGSYLSLDEPSLELFPMVYKRLTRLLPQDTWLTPAHNSYRYHWLKNTLLFHAVNPVMQTFREHYIPFILIKGGAWIQLYYKGDSGIRKTEDLDLYVEPGQVNKAIALLTKKAWHSSSVSDSQHFHPKYFHSLSMRQGDFHLDLHAHLFHRHYHGNDYHLVAPYLKSISWHDQSVYVLGDSDQLVHICVNAWEYRQVVDLRWIIDAAYVLRTGTINWDRVIDFASKKQVGLPVYASLKYLKNNFSLNIPNQVLKRLKAIHTSLCYRRLFALDLKGSDLNSSDILEKYFWFYYQGIKHKYNPFEWVIDGFSYLKYRLIAPTYSAIPRLLAIRLVRLGWKAWRGRSSVSKFSRNQIDDA